MKTRIVLIVLAFSIVFSSYARADAIKLKFANYFGPTYKCSVLISQFCEEIKRRTNGGVEITHHTGGTLLTAPKMFNGIVQGLSHMGLSTVAYNKGRFPLSEAQDLPLGFPSGYVGSQVANDFFKKFKPKEWDSVHVLFLYGVGPNVLQSLKKPVKTLQDLKGLKIRAVGRTADTVKALGATAVPVEGVDLYESLRRGVLDGAMMPAEVMTAFKLGELVKYVTAAWQGVGSSFVFYVAMNKDTWNSLPPDIKKIFDEVSEEYREKMAVLTNEIDIAGVEFLKKNGGEVITLSDADAASWGQAAATVVTNYQKDMVSKGFKDSEVKGWISFLKERITFWRQKEKEKAIPTPYK